jgi:O-antigen ligase
MRYLMAFFFFFIYMGDDLGINISLGPGLSVKNLLLYMIFIGIAIETAVARNRHFELPSVIIPFALLVLYAFLTWIVLAFIVASPYYSLRLSGIALKSSLIDQFTTYLIFFYAVTQLKDALWLLRTMIWIVVVGNIITIIDTFNVPNLGILDTPRKAGRFEGFIGQPNAYGQFLSLYFPATVALFFSVQGRLRILATVAALLTIMALVLTGSRGAYTGLILGSLVAAFFLRRHIPTRMLLQAGATGALVVAMLVVVTFATGYAEVYVDRVTNVDGSDHSVTSGRSTIWASAIRPMIDSPYSFITGFGFFSYESGRFYRSTHNMYLSYLYELGSIGLLLFLTVFARILLTARRSLVHASGEEKAYLFGLVFGLCGFMVAIFFSEYTASAYLLWAFMGASMRISVLCQPGNEPVRMPTYAPVTARPELGRTGGTLNSGKYQPGPS